MSLLALPFISNAQQTKSAPEMLETFDAIIGLENTKLYNGKRHYNTYKVTKENHNFFTSPIFIKGNVNYNEATFYNVNLKYDIFKDQLIFKPNKTNAYINIELIQDKVTSFELEDHNFVNSNTIIENQDIVTGYLEVIYKTNTLTFYAKRKKMVKERVKGNKLIYLFNDDPSYYLYYAHTFSEIKSSNSFKKLLPTLSKDLKIEIKESKNRFETEGLLTHLAKWADLKLQTKSTN